MKFLRCQYSRVRQSAAWKWVREHSRFCLTFVAFSGVVWSPLLPVVPLTSETPQVLYLLSAIAQSLAAFLALVFTISLVAAQLASGYSRRLLSRFFDRTTIAYMSFSIMSVILPFWFMAGRPGIAQVKLCLMLSGGCLFFLIPYLLSLREKLNPESLVAVLEREATEALSQFTVKQEGAISKKLDPIPIIENVIMSAYAQRDYETVHSGLRALSSLCVGAYIQGNVPLGNRIAVRLRDTGLSTLDDPRVPLLVIDALEHVCRGTVALDLPDDLAGAWLLRLGEKACAEHLEVVVRSTISAFFGCALAAVNAKRASQAGRLADHLAVLASRAIANDLAYLAEDAGQHLASVVSEAHQSGIELDAALASSLWLFGAWASFRAPGVKSMVKSTVMKLAIDANAMQSSYTAMQNRLANDPRLQDALDNFRRYTGLLAGADS